MKIQITNQQIPPRIRQQALRTLILRLLPHAHRLDPCAAWEQMAIHLVDDVGIQHAHVCYFGKDTVTDVISQRYAPLPGECGCTGEIIVNVQQALRAKAVRGWTPNRELALYIAHGIDHLHGGIDDTPTQRQQMRRRELRWLRKLQANGFTFESLGLEIHQTRKI